MLSLILLPLLPDLPSGQQCIGWLAALARIAASCSSGQLPEASQQSTQQSTAEMEILMDDPNLISLSSVSDSTDHSSNSNLSFHSLAIMLTQIDNNVRLGATAPSKKNNKSKTKRKQLTPPRNQGNGATILRKFHRLPLLMIQL